MTIFLQENLHSVFNFINFAPDLIISYGEIIKFDENPYSFQEELTACHLGSKSVVRPVLMF